MSASLYSVGQRFLSLEGFVTDNCEFGEGVMAGLPWTHSPLKTEAALWLPPVVPPVMCVFCLVLSPPISFCPSVTGSLFDPLERVQCLRGCPWFSSLDAGSLC